MPLYEYACRNCGEEFDALRSVNDLDSEVIAWNARSVTKKMPAVKCH